MVVSLIIRKMVPAKAGRARVMHPDDGAHSGQSGENTALAGVLSAPASGNGLVRLSCTGRLK